jgi:hypothetical protein
MDSGKGILKSGSVEFESAKRLLKEKHYLFLSLIDNMDTVSAALAYISDNCWDILLRVLDIFSGHYDSNYYTYENPHGLLFDANVKYIFRNSDAKAFIEGHPC